MRKHVLIYTAVALFAGSFAMFQTGCDPKQGEAKAPTKADMVARGKYLVNLGGCDHCHSPKSMTPQGPVPDASRLLSGHPADSKLSSLDPSLINRDHWIVTNGELTAWYGPWGVSYAANLTPDRQTGTGAWTEEQFMQSLRTGKHFGTGRDILPPMPWPNLAQLTNEDLKAIFAYLQSLKPINNPVPAPLPPQMASAK